MNAIDRVVAAVDAAADEIVQFTSDFVRIPSVNPPGEEYEACARFLGGRLSRGGFAVGRRRVHVESGPAGQDDERDAQGDSSHSSKLR